METVYQQRMRPASQLALLLGLCGAGIILGSIITVIVAEAMLHVPLINLEQAMMSPQNADASRVFQLVGTFFMIALPALVFSFIVNRKPFSWLGFNTSINFKQTVLVLLIVFAGLLASDLFAEINKWIPISKNLAEYFQHLEDEYDKQLVALVNIQTFPDYIISLFIMALVPAMFEEILFRGCLQQIMIGLFKKALPGILITSALFSAFHLSYYGFLPRWFLGILLGYIFYFSNNIWLSILAHFLNNAIGVTQIYLLTINGKFSQDVINAMDTHFAWYYGVAALVAVYFFFEVYKKQSEKVLAEKIMQLPNDEQNIYS